ncbi:hypothetical protein [Bacillus xiamenensis]|uniref:hypothetical protein n=2 Tax=Bacillus xiamenensis TaxID=1178537 RepID=UPI00028C7B48|nr:hypothetical protein [Bacillus xiamenensis]EKF33961.1 hypothetical protein BA1_17400 [Bacillus xiamenensis]
MKKVILSLSLTVGITILPTTFAEAINVDVSKEQKEIQEDYSSSTMYVQAIKETNKGEMSTNASKVYAKRLTTSRGSFLAWSKSYVDWRYSSGKIKSSSGSQDAGYVFPNIVEKNGSKRYYKGSTIHKWAHKTTLKFGAPTPWGDVTFVSNSYTDRVWVNGKGKHGWD